MTARVEVPFPPKLPESFSRRVDPPTVPIESVWEYKDLVRDAESADLPTEAELNRLGADGWELAGTVREGPRVHFYFKRERAR